MKRLICIVYSLICLMTPYGALLFELLPLSGGFGWYIQSLYMYKQTDTGYKHPSTNSEFLQSGFKAIVKSSPTLTTVLFFS